MKRTRATLITLAVLSAVVAIAACTSSTTNTTTPDLSATLNAHFATNYTLVVNFTRVSEANEAPVYSGSFQESNGTLHPVVIYVANNTSEAQKTFVEQKTGYIEAMPNATVNANTSAHFAITTNDTLINGWVVPPNTAGPYGLTLDSAYVLISQDLSMTTNETAAIVTAGVG